MKSNKGSSSIVILIVAIALLICSFIFWLYARNVKNNTNSNKARNSSSSASQTGNNGSNNNLSNNNEIIDEYEIALNEADADAFFDIMDFDALFEVSDSGIIGEEADKEYEEEVKSELKKFVKSVDSYKVNDLYEVKEKSDMKELTEIMLKFAGIDTEDEEISDEMWDEAAEQTWNEFQKEFVNKGYKVYILNSVFNNKDFDDIVFVTEDEKVCYSLLIIKALSDYSYSSNKKNQQALKETEISVFNSQFTTYKGKIVGSAIIDLLERCIANAAQNSGSDEFLPDIIFATKSDEDFSDVEGLTNIEEADNETKKVAEKLFEEINKDTSNLKFVIVSESENVNVAAMSKVKEKISVRHYYNVDFNTNEETGRIDYIIIVY